MDGLRASGHTGPPASSPAFFATFRRFVFTAGGDAGGPRGARLHHSFPPVQLGEVCDQTLSARADLGVRELGGAQAARGVCQAFGFEAEFATMFLREVFN